jgi:Winged helix DNA-binding domain
VTLVTGNQHDWIIRHRLDGLLLRGTSAADPAEAVTRLTAMQAQEHLHARWSVAQRTAGEQRASEIDQAFNEGGFLRTHVLRPTWHYVAATDLRWLIRLSGPRVDAGNTRMRTRLDLDAATLARSNDVIAEAVAAAPWTRTELAASLDSRGLAPAGLRGTYMVMYAELTAVICSGPMRGKQHTYAAFDRRVPADPGPDGDEALAELAWRYFSTRGPATVRDFAWWAGLSAGDARRGLAMVRPRLAAREEDGLSYLFAERNLPSPSASQVDLVQCYDEVIISYSQTRGVLNSPLAAFPVPGDIDGYRHVLLMGGRLLGHWRARLSRSGAEVETRAPVSLDDGQQGELSRAVEGYRRFTQPA